MPYKDPERQKRFLSEHYKKHKALYLQRSKRSRDRKLDEVNSIKEARGCKVCGITHPACLDFHHRNPDEKTMAVSELIRHSKFDDALSEVEKCDVLCANCHRVLHWEETVKNAAAKEAAACIGSQS